MILFCQWSKLKVCQVFRANDIIFLGSLLESAEQLISKEYPEVDIQFTSPYPVGTYKIGFGKEYRETSGLDGYQGL